MVVKQPRQTREIEARDLAELIGEPVLFDADWVREMADTYAYLGLILLYATVIPLLDVLACLIYAGVVGAILLMLRGQYLGLPCDACVRIALATSAATVGLDLIATIAGAGLPLPGILLWPLLMLGLGFIALRRPAGESAQPLGSAHSPERSDPDGGR